MMAPSMVVASLPRWCDAMQTRRRLIQSARLRAIVVARVVSYGMATHARIEVQVRLFELATCAMRDGNALSAQTHAGTVMGEFGFLRHRRPTAHRSKIL